MIITNDFVLLNQPKTGSTYLRECVKKLYERKTLLGFLSNDKKGYREIHLPKVYGNTKSDYIDQHGVLRQIPQFAKDLPIISVIRNPVERLESSYYFGWWNTHPLYDLDRIKQKFKNYPDLSLIEYAKLQNDPDLTPDNLLKSYSDRLGYATRLFLIFYTKDPESSARELLYENKKLTDIIPKNITLLRQEDLKNEFKNYITNNTKLDAAKIDYISKKNVSKKTESNKHSTEFYDYVNKMDYYLISEFYQTKF